ncbi:hypothetical protein ACFZAV_45430, partial [Streptomyces sp. NPDC008343]
MRRSVIFVSISAIAVFASACSTGSDGNPAEEQAKKKSVESSASPSADPGSVVRAAVRAAETSKARIDEEIRLIKDGEDLTISVKGAFDMKADKGSLTASLADTGKAAERAVSMDEIFSDGTLYFRMSGEQSGDTGWRSVSRDKIEVHSLMRAPLNELLRAGHRSGDGPRSATSEAPGQLIEMSDVSTTLLRGLVGHLSCR